MNFNESKLGDLCEIRAGGTPSRSKSEYWDNGDIPWIKIGDINNKYVKNASEYITVDGLNNSSAKLFKKGTILYTIFATVGEVAILDFDATTNQAIVGLNHNEKIDTNYLYYFLKSQKDKISNISRGVAQNNINMSILKDIKVPIPDKTVQLKISEVLDNAQGLIDKRKKQIEELDLLVKSKFIEMFGDPVINPKGWKYPKIEEVVANEKNAIKAGPFGSALKKEYYIKSGYKIYGQEQVISGDINLGDYYISEEKYKELENYAIKSNDVLISLVGTYGKLLIVPTIFEAGIINPRLMKITFNSNLINTIYFKFFFQSESLRNRLSDNTHGGTMPILNVGIVRNINIPIPPIELQNQFADFVKQVDKLKFEMEKSLKELEDNFNSLMQNAFKGELFK
ncbi:restriction endonuclease subunit S [Clostridium perfringens]